MICHAKNEDISRLKEIWQEAFGNEENFTEDFFTYAFSGEETLCYMENGQILGVLYMLPCRIMAASGKEEKAYYFYALATAEQFRGRGIMGKLIRHAQEEIKEQGCHTIFLIPASEGLISYYEQFGFDQLICPVTYVLRQEEPERILEEAMGVSVEEASFEERKALGVRTDWISTNRNVFFEERLEDFYRKRSMLEKESFFRKLVRGEKTVGFLEGTLEKDQMRIRNYGVDFLLSPDFLNRLFIEEKDRKIAVYSTDEWKHIQGFIPD